MNRTNSPALREGARPLLRSLWLEWVAPLALMLAVVSPLKSSIIDWNWVPTGSMEPTIMVGDLVLVNKLAYDLKVPFTTIHVTAWSDPGRGDIAVFFSPADGSRLVKRVVGLPGDTVELRNDILFVNGRPQSYALEDPSPYRRELPEDPNPLVIREDLGGRSHLIAVLPSKAARRSFGPVLVPQRHYFMMGDSRDNSFDSRYFGPVARDRIVGRATAVIASFDPSRLLLPRLSRFFTSLGSAAPTAPAS